MSKPIRVTVEDLETGDKGVSYLGQGDYMLIRTGSCLVDEVAKDGQGNVTINLVGHNPLPFDKEGLRG